MPLKTLITTPHLDKIIEPIYDSPKFVRTSLASIGAYVRESNGTSIKCIDAKFEQIKLDPLLQLIIDYKPDIVGISSFTYEFEEAAILAKEIKKSYSTNCIIVIGGPHASALPIETLERYPQFDICSIGESEITFSEIIKNINSQNWNIIDGIAYRNNSGEIIKTKNRDKISDINILPMPAWDLLPKAKEYFIQSSRGCPFNCYFCFNPNGTKVRTRSAENIITEIDFLINYAHPKRISFGDEAFGNTLSNYHNEVTLRHENLYKKNQFKYITFKELKHKPITILSGNDYYLENSIIGARIFENHFFRTFIGVNQDGDTTFIKDFFSENLAKFEKISNINEKLKISKKFDNTEKTHLLKKVLLFDNLEYRTETILAGHHYCKDKIKMILSIEIMNNTQSLIKYDTIVSINSNPFLLKINKNINFNDRNGKQLILDAKNGNLRQKVDFEILQKAF